VVLAACSADAGLAEGQPPAAEADGPYRLGSGDKLRIIVFGEQTLTGEYTITGAGELSFPLVGNIPAAGQTVQELQEAIRSRLAAGYLKDPRVSAEILDYRPYFILGEVNRPGQYPYSIGLTVEQAVAAAGGFTYRAKRNRIFIKRAMETSERLVNLKRTPSFPIRPGDTIRVAERFF